eukprot:575886_1
MGILQSVVDMMVIFENEQSSHRAKYAYDSKHSRPITKMSEIQDDYWRLLVETRIAIMEESDKYSLMDDENMDDKDFIYCQQQTVVTNIIPSLTEGWLSMNTRLLQEKYHWEGLTQAVHKIKDMIKTSKTMTNKLVLFQDEQDNVSAYLDHVQQYKSYRRIHDTVNDINKQLDSYAEQAKCALDAALRADEVENHTNIKLNWRADSYHWMFICLSSKVMNQEDPKGIFNKQCAEMAFKKANDMNYWLLLLTTRSKMKVLLIRCTIRKRNVIHLLTKNQIHHDEPGVDSLYTL